MTKLSMFKLVVLAGAINACSPAQVTSVTDTNMEDMDSTSSETMTVTETQTMTMSETQTETTSETQTMTMSETQTETTSETQTMTMSETQTGTSSEAEAETETQTQSETDTDTQTEVETPRGVVIPAVIQAEDFVSQQGVEIEATRDSGGGDNLGYINDSDYSEYDIYVPATGTYNIEFRVAGTQTDSEIAVLSDDELIDTIAVTSTAGWQTWATISANIDLEAGNQIIKLRYQGGDSYVLNINWFSLQENFVYEPVIDNGFTHPGLQFSINDLERMKANRNIEPWLTGWNSILETEGASDYVMQGPFEEVGNNPGINQPAHVADSEAVLFHALQWYFTRDESYAIKAIEILEAWAAVHTTWSGTSVHLHAAWRGGNFMTGAEILRYTYPSWTEQNTINTEKYFLDVYWPQFRFPTPLRAANQGANNLMGAMYVAVYLNDQEKFDQVIDAYLNDPCGGITNSLPNGQVGDTGRDQGHTMAQLGNLAMVAEIAWKQGVDLYGTLDNRLLTTHEYWAKYNEHEEDVPYTDFGTCYGYYTSVGADGRGDTVVHSAALNELIYGAYNIRKQMQTPYGEDLHTFGVDGNIDADILTFLHRKDASDNTTASAPLEPDAAIITQVSTSFLSAEIGEVDIDGSAQFANDTWTLTGSGVGIGLRYDGFHFEYQQVSGDAAIIAKIESVTEGGKACLTFRESLDQFVDMARVCAVQTKTETVVDAETGEETIVDSVSFVESSDIGKIAADGGGSQTFPLANIPIWLKLERRDEQVHTYVSPDGESWTAMTNLVMDLPEDYYMGLAMTSQDNTQTATGVFTNVQSSQ